MSRVNRFGDFLGGNPNDVGADGYRDSAAQVDQLMVDGWIKTYIGKGISRFTPNTDTPGKLAMTGLAVTYEARVHQSHRLVRFEWKHLDENLVDGTDATAAILSRDDSVPLPNVLWRLYYEAASVSSTTVVHFGEGYEYPVCTYIVSFNTTNGDWILPQLYLQEIKP